jgi:pimeloyl-ACP methyl ester carboxylesterase
MDTVRSADGTAIAFDQVGRGPALVLVMGAFCDRSSAAVLAAALGSSFTVYSYDRRGRGDSGDQPTYAAEREIEDLGAVIQAAGGSAFVYGHSSGAALALEAAASGARMRKLAGHRRRQQPGLGTGRRAAGHQRHPRQHRADPRRPGPRRRR